MSYNCILMKKNLLVFGFLSFALISASGSIIKGVVLDEQNLPVPFANVLLKNSADSSLYKGEIANEKGEGRSMTAPTARPIVFLERFAPSASQLPLSLKQEN